MLDGVDDAVQIADEGSFDYGAGRSLTIDAWVFPTSIVANNAEVIIAKGQDNGLRNWLFAIGQAGNLFLQYNDTSGQVHVYATQSGAIGTNQWRHVAVSYTFGTAFSAKLYIDGLEAPGAWTFGTGNSPLN